MPSEREAARLEFLASSGLAQARREPLAGDASTRRYERLHLVNGLSLILMDQPPAVETQACPPDATEAERRQLGTNALERLAAGRVDAFIACAGYLRGCGLSAPDILASDPAKGLAVLEDLGDDLFARLIETGTEEAPLYEAAIDALVVMHNQAPPRQLSAYGINWPLLEFDRLALETAGGFLLEWLPRLNPTLVFTDESNAQWEALWDPIHARGAAGASVFCHRDYHAENLIWLPARTGAARVGLLDFQDAVIAHPAWDLSMLLHDARRDVSPEREAAALNRYFAARPQVDREAFLTDYHALGALNIVRILGKFARLVVRDAKPRYQSLMPRMWRYLDRCLEEPAPAGLARWLETWIPRSAR